VRLVPRILVVDDEASIRELLSRFLTEQGYEIVLASSGIEAMASLQDREPDALVLDLALPKMSGLGVLRLIEEEKLEAGFVLVMSGQAHSASWGLDALDSGADQFIPKPFDLHVLEGIIAAGLKARTEPRCDGQRADPRVQMLLPVEIDLGTYGATLVGQTVDLSRGGIRVIVEQKVRVGTNCVVRIPQAAHTEAQDGTIIRVEPHDEGFSVAIEFKMP